MSKSTPTSTVVDEKLYGAWKKERAHVNLRGLCVVLLCLALGLPLYVLADWLLNLPWPGRLVAMAAVLAVAAVLARRHWWRQLRRFDPVRVALQVESCHPGLVSRLVSYVQLAPSGNANLLIGGLKDANQEIGAPSAQMVAVLRQEAVDASLSLDFEKIVDWARAKRLYLAAEIAAGVFLLSGAMSFDYARIALRRLIEPRAKYPTRTQVELLKSELVVAQGAPVELRFQGAGLVPGEGVLQIRFAGEERGDELTLLREENRLFRYHLDAARKSFAFSFLLGDAATDTEHVTVVQKPMLSGFQVTCTAPPYTHRAPESQDKTLNLNVLEGTQIEWHLAFDQPLERMWMVMAKGAPPQVKLDSTGSSAAVKWTAQQGNAYHFGFTPKGRGFNFTDEVEYTIEVKADEPPRVEILKPENNATATLNWKAPVKFRASDDYGLLSARLVFWREEGKEQRQELGVLASNPAEMEFIWKLKEAAPNLQPGDTLSYCVEAGDNYPGAQGPHWSRSQVQAINILSPEDYLEFVRAERERLNTELEVMMKTEESDAQGIKELKEKLKRLEK